MREKTPKIRVQKVSFLNILALNLASLVIAHTFWQLKQDFYLFLFVCEYSPKL
jgi:hypothetical protein